MSLHNRIASVTRRPSPQDDDAVDESSRRWAKRKGLNSKGQILFDGITTPYACVVRDASSTGARIEMTRNKYNPDGDTSFIPPQFTLLMPLERTRVECQSMWRRGTYLGARFLGAVRHLPPPTRKPTIGRKK